MKIDQLPAAPVPTSASEPRDLEVKGKGAGQLLGSAPTDSRGDELKGSTVLCFQDSNPALNHAPICKPLIFPRGD